MSPTRIRAVILDFDGVLVDSEPIRFKAGSQALEEIGISLTWDRFMRFWLGRTDDAGLRRPGVKPNPASSPMPTRTIFAAVDSAV